MIPSTKPHLLTAAVTHPGMTGKNNEDRFSITAYRLRENEPTPVVFAILADGMGGHRAGEVAAEIAVETINRIVGESDGRHPLQTLKQAMQQASQAIREEGDQNPDRKGMGTTAVCAWVIDHRLYMVSTGNSRIYLLRAGLLRQLSIDHTWVQAAMEYGILTAEQARGHPNASVIDRYLGSSNNDAPDFRLRLESGESDEVSESHQGLGLHPDDILFLCSDGLSDLVEDHEISEKLQTSPLRDALEALTALACERGGHDNITSIALAVPGPKNSRTAQRKQNFWLALMLLVDLIMILVTLVSSLFILDQILTP